MSSTFDVSVAEKIEHVNHMYDYLKQLFLHHVKVDHDDVNEFIIERVLGHWQSDLRSLISACWDMLCSVTGRHLLRELLPSIEDDTCAICVQYFRPCFRNGEWIRQIKLQDEQAAQSLRLQLNVFEATDGLYCSTIKYLEQLVADASV